MLWLLKNYVVVMVMMCWCLNGKFIWNYGLEDYFMVIIGIMEVWCLGKDMTGAISIWLFVEVVCVEALCVVLF